MKKSLIIPARPPVFCSWASAGGKMESEGPLARGFDILDATDRFGKETWEQSESEMQRRVFSLALGKAGLKDTDIGAVFAGDLMNQCVGSTYGLLPFDLPYFGLYGACSTAVEGLILSSLALESGHFEHTAAVTSSHFYSSERQFRYPVEYGGQRAPTSQWTVTGAGAFILGHHSPHAGPCVAITALLPGRVCEKGITDLNNMGAAMAPVSVKLRPYPVRK